MRRIVAIVTASMLLAGCTYASGIVRDASTGKPIANASLETSNGRWGFRDGQLVWDKQEISAATSGSDGSFRFNVAGGTGLRVRARGYPNVETSFCSRDTLVRMGGPYPELRTERRLIFADALGPSDVDRLYPPRLGRDLGLSAFGDAFGSGTRLRVEAAGGLRFVAGTGAIPPAPQMPYAKVVDLDFSEDCGWLFVSDGRNPVAVVEVRHPSGSQVPGGAWVWSMWFAALPAATTE